MRKVDLTGKKFGYLTVVKEAHQKTSTGHLIWVCLCVCGKTSEVPGGSLTTGAIKSCGCKKHELMLKSLKKPAPNFRHGFTRRNKPNKFYYTYRSIVTRCTKPSSRSFKYYGRRGVKCLWKNFEEFKQDMYFSYKEHYKKYGKRNTTINRIDNNGNYSKENCEWTTHAEQARNKTTTHLLKVNGKEKCFRDVAKTYNLNETTLYARLYIYKWPFEKAIKTPVRKWIRATR